MEPLDFSTLTIQEVAVISPEGTHYTLREANGKTATEHRNAIMSSTIFGPDGKVTGIKDLASVEARFIASCLWDEKGKNPSVTLVQSWPARVQKKLYESAKDLSDFSEDTPLREALEKALALESCPIDGDVFAEWVRSLDEEEYKPLIRLFGKSDLKNS